MTTKQSTTEECTHFGTVTFGEDDRALIGLFGASASGVFEFVDLLFVARFVVGFVQLLVVFAQRKVQHIIDDRTFAHCKPHQHKSHTSHVSRYNTNTQPCNIAVPSLSSFSDSTHSLPKSFLLVLSLRLLCESNAGLTISALAKMNRCGFTIAGFTTTLQSTGTVRWRAQGFHFSGNVSLYPLAFFCAASMTAFTT